MVAGGDSGGPSFVKGRSSSAFGATDMIAGVHSLCNVLCADGKNCSIGAPNPWQWVTSVPTCADAAIAPLWPQISKLLEPSFSNQTFDTSLSKDGLNILYTVDQDGTLTWRQHNIRYPNGSTVAVHTFSAPKAVGSGWAGGHRDVMAMGQLGIYSLLDDGTLRWNWHLGFADGSVSWRNSQDLAKGLTGFKQIVAQDKGVVYGLLPGDPGIFWGYTTNYDQKKGAPSTTVSLRLNPENINFAAFKKVFGGGNGVLYAIDYAGNLLWMKHNFYLSPIPDPGFRIPGSALDQARRAPWSGPVVIGSGFSGVTQAFSSGEGHIYYITENGALVWRRHVGWKDGTPKWDNPNSYVIANGWGSYKFAFARNTTSDLGSGNPALEIIVNE